MSQTLVPVIALHSLMHTYSFTANLGVNLREEWTGRISVANCRSSLEGTPEHFKFYVCICNTSLFSWQKCHLKVAQIASFTPLVTGIKRTWLKTRSSERMRIEKDFEASSPSHCALQPTPSHSSASDIITIDANAREIKSHHRYVFTVLV